MPYQSYRLRSYYEKEPSKPTRCLLCAGELTITSVEPSVAVREEERSNPSDYQLLHFSYLGVCQQCGWWCFHESWEYFELGPFDYLTAEVRNVAVKADISVNPPNSSEPWLPVFKDKDLYDTAIPFPREFARIFTDGVVIPKPKKERRVKAPPPKPSWCTSFVRFLENLVD